MFFKNSQIYIITTSLYEIIILYFYKNMANKQKLFIFIPYMQKCIFKLIVILLKSTIILYFKFESFINLLYFKVGSVFTAKNYIGVMLYEEIN